MLLTLPNLNGPKRRVEGKIFICFVCTLIVKLLLCSLICETPEGYTNNILPTITHYSTPHAGYQPYQKAGDSVRLQDKMNGNDTEVTTWTMSSTSASASIDTGVDTTQETSSSDRTAVAGHMSAMMRGGPGSSRWRSSSVIVRQKM